MKILCCGDSHVNVFNCCNNELKNVFFEVCEVGGATAQGLVNPNSKTNALPIFEKKINDTKMDKLLIMLGEVDCGFVIWVRSKRYNISVDEQINNSINNIFFFIQKILDNNKYLSNKDIIVVGAILPTIKDSTNKKFLGGARSEVDISQIERTKKTIEYNNLLKNNCNVFGYNYIDITEYIISNEGIVKDYYLNINPYDHHLDSNKTFKLWISKLKCILML